MPTRDTVTDVLLTITAQAKLKPARLHLWEKNSSIL